MAAARKSAARAAKSAVNNPYIQRVMADAQLRDDIRDALDHTRSAYERLSNGKHPAKALMDDKKLQKEIFAVHDFVSRAFTESTRPVAASIRTTLYEREREAPDVMAAMALGCRSHGRENPIVTCQTSSSSLNCDDGCD